MGLANERLVDRQLDRLFRVGTMAGLGDAELLGRFVSQRDEPAFEALVARHGPMVLAVCRRLLGDQHEADDAFQATFLILVRRAGSIAHRQSLASWLYGVAYKVAARARAQAARRPGGAWVTSDPCAREEASASDLVEQNGVLHEEIGRLSARLRAPIVLCYFEGLTQPQAAAQLGCPLGTVRSRLARGRERLRRQLTRRGVRLAGPAIALAVNQGTAQAAVPPRLVASTLRLVHLVDDELLPAALRSLLKGAMASMFTTKLKVAASAGLVLGLAAGAGVALAFQAGGRGSASLPQPPARQVASSPASLRSTAGPAVQEAAPNPDLQALEDDLRDEIQLLQSQLDARRAEAEAARKLHKAARDSLARTVRLRQSGGAGVVSDREFQQLELDVIIKEARLKVLEAEEAEATVLLNQAKRRLSSPASRKAVQGAGLTGLDHERRLRSLEQKVEQLSADLEALKKAAR